MRDSRLRGISLDETFACSIHGMRLRRASCSKIICLFWRFHVKLYLQKKAYLFLSWISDMHETSLIKEMLEVAARVQRDNHHRPIASLKVEISEFGGWDPDHFREHFAQATIGSDWQGVRLDIVSVPTGPEARLTQVTFQS